VDELTFNADGSVPEVLATRNGVAPVSTLDPYKRVEAETIAWASGVETAKTNGVGVFVTEISNGDYIKVCNVDFGGAGAARFMAGIASLKEGGTMELRLDNEAGPVIGTLKVKPSGDGGKWETQACAVSGAKGVHDLVLKFAGEGELGLDVDWWKFE
jgi:hypothetical protein